MRPERTIPHLELRRSGFFWRRRFSGSFWFDPHVFRLSLRTRDPLLAIPLALRLTELSSRLFEVARSAQMNTSEMHALITETLAREVREADRLRMTAPPRSREDAASEQAQLDALVATLREAITLRDYRLVHDMMRTTAKDLGIAPDETSLAWRSAAHQTVRGLLDATQERIAHDRGEFDEPSVFFRSARAQARSSADILPFAARPTANPAAFASHMGNALPRDPGAMAAVGASVPVVAQSVAAMPAVAEQEQTMPAFCSEAAPSEQKAGDLPVLELANNQAEEPTGKLSELHEPADAASPAQNLFTQQVVEAISAGANLPTEAAVATQAVSILASLPQPTPLLSEMSDRFLEHLKAGYAHSRTAEDQVSTGERTKKQMENASATMRIFLVLIGDRPIGSVTKQMCADAFRKLSQMPNTFCRSGKKMTELLKGKRCIDDVIAGADGDEAAKKKKLEKTMKAKGISEGNIRDALLEVQIERLSANTVYRKMQEVKRFFEFAMAEDLIPKNPMQTVIWTSKMLAEKKKKEGERTRLVWGDDLPRLLRTPRFSTKLVDIADPMFWAVIISLYTGMRMEEILQLRVDDFETDRGIWLIRVTDTHGRRLKNEAARRRIPIHSFLLGLGLLDLVQMRQDQSESYLFPHLERGPRETRGAAVSKEFTEYRRAHKLYKPRKDFHSLRKTANQRMLDLNVSAEIRYALLGHTNNSVNLKNYSDGFPIEHLRDAIEKLDFNTSMVLSPFAEARESNVTQMSAYNPAA